MNFIDFILVFGIVVGVTTLPNPATIGETMKVVVSKRSSRGREFITPINETAKQFARIQGEKSRHLYPDTMTIIEGLGVEVEIVEDQAA